MAPRSNPDHGSILPPRHGPFPSPEHRPLHSPKSLLLLRLLLAAELCEKRPANVQPPGRSLQPSAPQPGGGGGPPQADRPRAPPSLPLAPHLTPSPAPPGWAFSEDILPLRPSFGGFARCPVPPLKFRQRIAAVEWRLPFRVRRRAPRGQGTPRSFQLRGVSSVPVHCGWPNTCCSIKETHSRDEGGIWCLRGKPASPTYKAWKTPLPSRCLDGPCR